MGFSKVFFAFLFLFLSFRVLGKPSSEILKNLSLLETGESLKEEGSSEGGAKKGDFESRGDGSYDFLNPIDGMIFIESGALENIAELSYEDDFEPLKKMTFFLYHRLNSDEFIPSRSDRSLSSYLTPHLIGTFLGLILKAKENEVSHEEIKKKMKANLQGIIEERRGKKGAKKTNLNKIVNLFLDNKEDDNLYKPFLALLWEKSESKKGILEYYEGLKSVLGDKIFSSLGKEVLSNRDKQKDWLQDNFSFLDSSQEGPSDFSNYEKRLYATSILLGDFPLERQKYAFPREGSKENFADCGATSLKNFFKLILERNRKGSSSLKGDYEIRVLRKLNAHQEVISFFSRFKTRASQKSQEARNLWGKITCGKKDVDYLKKIEGLPCEINAGRKNMLNLINRLLFVPVESFYPDVRVKLGYAMEDFVNKAETWEELGEKIERAREQVWGEKRGEFSFSSWEGTDNSDDIGVLSIELGSFNNYFNWKFQENHFYIEPKVQGKLPPLDGLLEKLRTDSLVGKRALNIYSLYPTTIKKVRDLKSLENPYAKYYTSIKSDESSVVFMKGLRKEGRSSNSSADGGSGKEVEEYFSLSEEQITLLYIAIKKKRASDNPDLLRRLVKASYPHSAEGLYNFYQENKGERKELLKEEFEAVVQAGGRSLSNQFLSLSFEKTPSYLDLKTGPLFVLTGNPLNLDDDGSSFLNELKGAVKHESDLFNDEERERLLSKANFLNEKNETFLKLPYVSKSIGYSDGESFEMESASFSKNDTLLLKYQNLLVFINTKTGGIIRTTRSEYPNMKNGIISPDGQSFLMRHPLRGAAYRCKNGEEKCSQIPENEVDYDLFSPYGSKALPLSREGKISSEEERWEFFNELDFSFSSVFFNSNEEKLLILARPVNYEHKIGPSVWNIKKEAKIFSLTPDYSSAIFSPDGSKILAFLRKGGEKAASLFNSSTGEEIFTFYKEADASSYVTTFNSEGTKIVTSSIKGTAKIWDLCAIIPKHMDEVCN